MPVIGEKTYKQIDLVTEGAWVKILTNPNSEIWEQVQGEADLNKAGAKMFSSLIVEWNFTDAQGNASPIDAENCEKALSAFDILKISRALGMSELMLSGAKKNSSIPTSLPVEKSHPQPNMPVSSTENTSI